MLMMTHCDRLLSAVVHSPFVCRCPFTFCLLLSVRLLSAVVRSPFVCRCPFTFPLLLSVHLCLLLSVLFTFRLLLSVHLLSAVVRSHFVCCCLFTFCLSLSARHLHTFKFFSRINVPILTKLGINHPHLKSQNICKWKGTRTHRCSKRNQNFVHFKKIIFAWTND